MPASETLSIWKQRSLQLGDPIHIGRAALFCGQKLANQLVVHGLERNAGTGPQGLGPMRG